jgi:hypothetical protein
MLQPCGRGSCVHAAGGICHAAKIELSRRP